MADGTYTNAELIDTIIVDLNNMVKEQINGQLITACAFLTQATQKLLNLRKTIDNDIKNREKTIETLKEELRCAGVDVVDMTPQEFLDGKAEKDGAE